MIDFNVSPIVDTSTEYVGQALLNKHVSGDGPFTKKCSQWLQDQTGSQKVLLTTSGTAALEMAAHLCNFEPGDEVILPSFTFSSTATAFVNVGAKLVFVDIDPKTMNIDPVAIEQAITEKTKAIAVVHYAGVGCDMDAIMAIAKKHSIKVVEDAAQAVMSFYKGKPLGAFGDFGCFSFHETKNYSMGEGGALLIRDSKNNEPAEILREKGTNRSKFFRGQIDKYSWVDFGSSYLPSDINAAYLWSQLEIADEINNNRLETWNAYMEAFRPLEEKGYVELPHIPEKCTHNAHLFYIKCKDLEHRTEFINYCKENGVGAVFHYVPLHSAPAGKKFGFFNGEDVYTTSESERLMRLPLYYQLTKEDRNHVIKTVLDFFNEA